MDEYDQLSTPDNLIKRIEALETIVRSLRLRDTEANVLSDISDDAGEIRAGSFICGEGDPYNSVDGAFTGVALLSPGIDPTGSGTTYEMVGMNAGALEVGIDNLGKLLAGAGAVVLDKEGIAFELPETTYTPSASLKWTDGAEYPIQLRGMVAATVGVPIDTVVGSYMVQGSSSIPNADLSLLAMYNGSGAGAAIGLHAQLSFTRAYIAADELWITSATTIKMEGTVVQSDGVTPLVHGLLAGNGNNTTVASGSTAYSGFGYFGTTGTQQNVEVGMYIPATLGKFTLRTRSAQPGTGALTVTIADTGSGVYATIVIPAGAAAGVFSVDASTPAWPGNERFRVKFVNAASAASAQIAGFSLEYS